MSKLIERIACLQLVDRLKENYLYKIFQSEYRQLHSTETTLLRVQNYIFQAVDSAGGAILILLNLSATFDIIHHKNSWIYWITHLELRVALRWFKSYLQDETQTVQIKTTCSTSKPVMVKYGIPEGAVLGPILFTMHTTPLDNIIRNFGLDFYMLMMCNFIYNLS